MPLLPKAKELFWMISDTGTTWRKVAQREAARLVERSKIDVMWTTSGPYDNLIVGSGLKRQYGLPWVADLRDPVSTDASVTGYAARLVRGRRQLYRRAARQADAVTAATPQVVEMDREWLGQSPELIVSGFDNAVWEEARRTAVSDPMRFEIVFTGAFYSQYRRPDLFLRGLAKFVTGLASSDVEAIRFVYYGRDGSLLRRLASDAGVGNLVEDRGFIPPGAVPSILSSATALLLLTNERGDSGVPGGKFYEYLGAHRPILAVPGADQFVQEVFRKTRAGILANDEDDVSSTLAGWFAAWRANGDLKFPGDDHQIERYSARQAVERLSDVLTAAAGNAAGDP